MKRGFIFILTLGVFSIINTEMGVVGILPMIATQYGVPLATAGLLVSLFALVVAVSGPTLPLLFSRFNRKSVMVLVLSVFLVCNLIAAFATSFSVVLAARVLPAFFHPIYVSLALSAAGASVSQDMAPKAVAKVMMGVSAGMVLGAPVVGSLAGFTSLRMGMLFFALINAIALVATLVFVPSLPVASRLSYGKQLQVLKRGKLWLSLLGVVCLNGAVFGVYSYLSAYLGTVTGLPGQLISLLLFFYGLANIVGNALAGKLLAVCANRFVMVFPMFLVVVYSLLVVAGGFAVPTALLILLWGVLAGAGANINQYWIVSAAPDAPDFANGLFLAATNLGTTVGATLCGALIAGMGMPYVLLGGMLLLAVGFLLVVVRLWLGKRQGGIGQEKQAVRVY